MPPAQFSHAHSFASHLGTSWTILTRTLPLYPTYFLKLVIFILDTCKDMFLGTSEWNLPNTCLSEAKEEEGVWSCLLPFYLPVVPQPRAVASRLRESAGPLVVTSTFSWRPKRSQCSNWRRIRNLGWDHSHASRVPREKQEDTVIVCNEVFLSI